MSGVIETAVKAVLPDVLGEAERLALEAAGAADKAIAAPPWLEALLVFAVQKLLDHGAVEITTDAPITVRRHRGPHPADVLARDRQTITKEDVGDVLVLGKLSDN